MTRVRAAVLSLLTLAALASPVLANPAPPPDWKDSGGSGGRTGLFRSCGAGAGAGLAGIGVLWGLMWVGRRRDREK